MEYLIDLKSNRFWINGIEHDLPKQFTSQDQEQEIKNWLVNESYFDKYEDYIEFEK